jgi:hypothetical protein
MLPLMSPEQFSNQMPLPPLRVISQSAAGAFALQHRCAAVEDQFGGAADADQLRAVLQAQHAGAIDPRR